MDWEKKFYSIVKETDNYIAKAKEKLSGKSSSTFDKFPVGAAAASNRCTDSFQQNLTPLPLTEISALNMASDYNVQLLQLQEQINYQSRTIETLQKLVISLNSERNFHKEQISRLKDDMDKLTDKTSSQFVAANSERQVSAMKRELMHELEKVKAMLQNYVEESSNTKRSSLSSSLNEDFWTMKESLTENLEQVQREINAMSKRLDKLESPIGAEPCDKPRQVSFSKNVHYTDRFQRPPLLYTPLYKSSEDISSLDLKQLRQTVNSLNSKLDNLEKKIDTAQFQQPLVTTTHQWSGHTKHPYMPASHKSSLLDIDNDDLNSISDLSDFSSLSGNTTDNSIDALTSELQGSTTLKRRTRNKRPAYKTGRAKKGTLGFDLSDSDIDGIDLDTDSLDLDN